VQAHNKINIKGSLLRNGVAFVIQFKSNQCPAGCRFQIFSLCKYCADSRLADAPDQLHFLCKRNAARGVKKSGIKIHIPYEWEIADENNILCELACILLVGAGQSLAFSESRNQLFRSSGVRSTNCGSTVLSPTNINLQNADHYYKFPDSKPAFTLCASQSFPAKKESTTPEPNTPQHFILHQNYPHPFNERTFLKFEIDRQAFLDLTWKILKTVTRAWITLI